MASAFAGSGHLIFETTGRTATRVVGAGNGLRENRLLASLVADAFALPMVVARYREEAGLGAALVAAAGVGICDDLQAASQAVKFN
jgi:sugar (pentulose or hexulose) kinase